MRTPSEDRAIRHFMDATGAKPQLSTRPYITFLMPDGTKVDRLLSNLVIEHKKWKEENKRKKKDEDR